jgi:hypothetical protein
MGTGVFDTGREGVRREESRGGIMVTEDAYTHDKNRDCKRTDEVLDHYRRRALAAERTMHKLVRILREMYTVQARTDAEGGREVAAWYYLDQLEGAAEVHLTEYICPQCGQHYDDHDIADGKDAGDVLLCPRTKDRPPSSTTG